MKTLKQFERQTEKDLDEFLKPLERIDEELYYHIICGYVPSNFESNGFGQNGECSHSKDGIRYYSTVMSVGDKYYYLGLLPSFDPSIYYRSQAEKYRYPEYD